CSNYGAAGPELLDENAPLNPVTPYAVSKVACEEQLDRLASPGFSPVYLRSATAYGLSPRLRFDLVVNNLTAWAVATGEVRLKSDGKAWRPLVHVRDIARAFLLLLEADRALVHAQAFNVGRNDEIYQIRDIANIVNAAVGGSQITSVDSPIADPRNYRVDCSKIRRLGFSPDWTVPVGVQELLAAFRSAGLRTEDFEGPRFQRVAQIRHLMNSGEIDAGLRRRQAQFA
ncbi:MAG: NAD-dependent epimerase/dehydratase family protein, partial [Paracoccaceae bacterium]